MGAAEWQPATRDAAGTATAAQEPAPGSLQAAPLCKAFSVLRQLE